MKSRRSHPVGSGPCGVGFTLIELLVVMAVLSILLALMLPALHKARALSHRIVCASQLRQIALAWHAYLGDHNRQFYQAVNANHYFGGWRGITGGAVSRPLNRYVGLPTRVNVQSGAKLFRCPADQGDDYGSATYLYYGNSYQTNLLLIGPDSLPTHPGLPEPIRELNRQINPHLKNLKAEAVCEPSRLLLVGDNNWVTQWDRLMPGAGRTWHDIPGRYNLAFFDGHITLIEIHKGIYLDDDYRILPFQELNGLAGGIP